MKRDTPALNEEGPQHRLTPPSDPVAVLARRTEAGDDWAFTLVNTDDEAAQEIELDALLATEDAQGLMLDDMTPGIDERGLGLRLVVDPVQIRVLRGRKAAPPVRPVAEPSVRAPGGAHPDWSPTARILIEDVYPEIDGARFPVKRSVGDTLAVWADILRDGHDVLRAAVLYRPEQASEWREAPMRLFDNDRWVGEVPLLENARYRYTIEAWTDHFASWRKDSGKKRDAQQPIVLELVEGRALVAAAAARASGPDRTLFERALRDFDQGDAAYRAELMLSRLLEQAMARWPDRDDATRYRHELEVVVDRPRAVFGAWYEMFLRSQGRVPGKTATFDDGIARLPEIQAMGFDVVYLPPIHPIGRINRKGRDNTLTAQPGDPGSPYAIGAAEGGHDAVHPELGGIAGFRRFVAAVRERGMEVALDFAIQCAPDHPWVEQHPEWFSFRPDGTHQIRRESAQEVPGHRQCRVLQP